MSPFWTGAIFGCVVGLMGATYALSKPFRDGVNSRVAGVLGGRDTKKTKKNGDVAEKPKPKLKLKEHMCGLCGQMGTSEDSDEVSVEDGSASFWAHRHCIKEKSERR